MTPGKPIVHNRSTPLLAKLDSKRWKRVSAIADQAMELPASEVTAFLDRTCGDDRDLRAAVESLLAADASATGFLEKPAIEIAVPTTAEERHGERDKADLAAFAGDERLADRYRIVRLLGVGGMSEVYEAWDEELSIPVALKILRLPAGSEVEAIRRLKRESLLARSVSHPNVCRVFDLGRHGEDIGAVCFLTMEVLRGETLAGRLQREGRVTEEKALPIVEQIASGLGAAHRAGVVHRDFKPSNVMLVSEETGEQAVVTDFGIARLAVDEEADSQLLGTPAYMAPEQVCGEDISPAADIYALGIVLYEMVTGTVPFTGGAAIDVARRRLSEEVPLPRSIVPELSERWETVILRCLAREPRRRFTRAEEVTAALTGRSPVHDIGLMGLGVAVRVSNTLPAERDAFIGRERDLGALADKLTGSGRLVTLLGAGGMGKTRLAVRYGWQTLGEWPGGAWFCDLTEARTLGGIASAVSGSLGVPLGRGDPIEQLGHAIAGRGRCLVILDNFEQVSGHAADTVSRWMERAKEGRFLVTSRVRLSLGDEEQEQAVEPLSLDHGLELFSTRARWLRPGLVIEGMEAESALDVVRLVEGMPLAIELAAARMRVMSASQIVAQMRRRFQLLTGGPSSRHETLAAVIEGSWELLSPWEKAAFAQCSVFEGGFTLEAAEGVLDLGAWPKTPWVVDLVQSLVDKSLLRMWIPEKGQSTLVPETRFGMYVTIQEYARKKLDEAESVRQGASREATTSAAEKRHGAWYARYGREDAIDRLDGEGGMVRRRALQRELENLLAACRRAVARGDDRTAAGSYLASWAVLDLAGPFGLAMEIGRGVVGGLGLGVQRAKVLRILGLAELRSGRMSEARDHFEEAVGLFRGVGDRRNEGIVLGDLGRLHHLQGRVKEARAHCDTALVIARELSDRRAEGVVLHSLGILHSGQDRMEEARAHYEAALIIARELGDRRAEGVVLGSLGIVHASLGRMEEARVHYDAELGIYRELGDRRREGMVLKHLGNLVWKQGRVEEARAHYEAVLHISREVGDRGPEGAVLGNLGLMHASQGRIEEARAHYEAALSIARELDGRYQEACALSNLGTLSLEQGRMEDARAHYEEVLAIARELGKRHLEGIALTNLGNLHVTQGRVAEAREILARGEEILREVADPIILGQFLCTRARMEFEAGDPAQARATLNDAETLAEQFGANLDSELGRMISQVREAMLGGPNASGGSESPRI